MDGGNAELLVRIATTGIGIKKLVTEDVWIFVISPI